MTVGAAPVIQSKTSSRERGQDRGPKPTPSLPDQLATDSGHVDVGAVPTLWHFTCDHRAPSILAVGALVPMRHYWLPEMAPVVWLTDQAEPSRLDVGLTSRILQCDRMAHRFRVLDASTCVPWNQLRHLGRRTLVNELEAFGNPATWWVSTMPVPVALA